VKVVFYSADKEREGLIALAFSEGVMRHGDISIVKSTADYELPEIGTDVAVVIGVKGKSRKIIDDHKAMGKKIIYIDKGYFRIANVNPDRLSRSLYYKVSINDFQPLDYLMDLDVSGDRWSHISKKFKLKPKKWESGRSNVVWLGPSQKYCTFHGLGDATKFSESCINILIKKTGRDVVYRPKHSWADATPIKGTRFSRPPVKIEDEFKDAYALATHGSNMSAEAILSGVPVIAFGPAIARPLATTEYDKFNDVIFPSDESRLDWLRKISYCQWTVAEMASGLMWSNIRHMV
jgi:hypothetical protein